MENKYKFRGKIWRYGQPSGWHFVTIPKVLAKRIRAAHGSSEEGWGRLKAKIEIGKTKWISAIWYDTKAGSYLLPIKAGVRKSESLKSGSSVTITLYIFDDSKPGKIIK